MEVLQRRFPPVGRSISKGDVFWGSGYSNLFGAFGGPNNKLYAFSIR